MVEHEGARACRQRGGGGGILKQAQTGGDPRVRSVGHSHRGHARRTAPRQGLLGDHSRPAHGEGLWNLVLDPSRQRSCRRLRRRGGCQVRLRIRYAACNQPTGTLRQAPLHRRRLDLTSTMTMCVCSFLQRASAGRNRVCNPQIGVDIGQPIHSPGEHKGRPIVPVWQVPGSICIEGLGVDAIANGENLLNVGHPSTIVRNSAASSSETKATASAPASRRASAARTRPASSANSHRFQPLAIAAKAANFSESTSEKCSTRTVGRAVGIKAYSEMLLL